MIFPKNFYERLKDRKFYTMYDGRAYEFQIQEVKATAPNGSEMWVFPKSSDAKQKWEQCLRIRIDWNTGDMETIRPNIGEGTESKICIKSKLTIADIQSDTMFITKVVDRMVRGLITEKTATKI